MRSILFAFAFLAAGVALDIYSGGRLVSALQSRNWPTADGSMGTSEIETTRSRRSANYSAHVAYTYVVEGKTFAGNTVSFGNEGNGDRSEAQTIVDRFPRGSAIKVHYEPGNPANCSLIVGIETWRDFVPIFIGLGLTGIGGYALAQTLRARGKKTRAPRKPLRS